MDSDSPHAQPGQSGATGGADHIQVGKIEGSQAVAIGRGATAVYQGLTIAEVAALMVELKRRDQPKVWDGRIPYPGLQAFQESDARFFFGREKLVADLLARVQQASFITIAGPSGSGKSSAARAGLLHALREGCLPKSDRWLLATMQPGSDPIEQLTAAVERVTQSPGTGNHIRRQALENALALHEQVQTLLTDDAQQRFVLLVDPFEETFTQTREEAVRSAFINLLTAAVQTPESRAIILLALRSDFVSHCARYPDLRELMSRQFQLVGAMEPADLARAITLPALEVGAEMDPALVSRIIADMKGEPGALPLMSFALRDLFETERGLKGEPMHLTFKKYLDRGGVENALERHADQVLARFSEEQQELAKSVFSRLVEIGQGRVDTRRTAVLDELTPAGKDAAEVAAVVDSLAREGARLLTVSGRHDNQRDEPGHIAVTLAHEKLIDAWPWLRRLVDENRELIALQNQVASDAQAWARQQDAGYLYRGGRLAQMEEKLAELGMNLNELSQQFIQASLDAKEAEQQTEAEQIQKEEALRQEQANAGRFRRLTRGLSMAVVIAVIASLAALLFMSSARTSEAEVQQLKRAIQASQLGFASHTEATHHPETALLLAVAGFGTNIQADTRVQLGQRLQALYRTTLYGHEGSVYSVVFSPDGQTILTASDDRTARLWNRQGEELAILRGHTDSVWSAVFSPDGQTILTASHDHTARLWNRQGAELAVLRGHEGWVDSAVFSPDGQMILTASSDGTARLWNRQGAELVALRGHKDSVWSAVFSPDGQTILTAGDDRTARLWNRQGEEVVVLRGHEDWVNSADFSPDGQTILTAGNDGTARLWNRQGEELAVLRGDEGAVNSAVFSPDDQIILTASSDGTARLWNRQGAELAVLRGHEDRVWSAVFSPDGQMIVTASGDGTARLWNRQGVELTVLRGHEGWVDSAVFSPDGRTILTAGKHGIVRLWNQQGDELAVLHGHERSINSAVFHPDGQMIVTASGDGTARLWNRQGEALAILRGHEDTLYSAVFSPDGQMIMTASYDRTARLWSQQGEQLAVLRGHEGPVRSAIFSPDGQTVLTASADGTARLWSRQGETVAILRGHEAVVYSAALSPDGQTILTASWDRTARLWNLQGEERVILHGHENSVLSAVFSPDGQMIMTASYDRTARLWNRQGEELAVLHGHAGPVRSAVFSPDGHTILTASDDHTVRLWNRQGEELAVWRGHVGEVRSAVFSPDGQTILTADHDGTARLWPHHTVEYMVQEAYWRIRRGFTEAECRQYFRYDLAACPRTKKQLFAPLVDYFSPEQRHEWERLDGIQIDSPNHLGPDCGITAVPHSGKSMDETAAGQQVISTNVGRPATSQSGWKCAAAAVTRLSPPAVPLHQTGLYWAQADSDKPDLADAGKREPFITDASLSRVQERQARRLVDARVAHLPALNGV
jgi:WD40 repeat protein